MRCRALFLRHISHARTAIEYKVHIHSIEVHLVHCVLAIGKLAFGKRLAWLHIQMEPSLSKRSSVQTKQRRTQRNTCETQRSGKPSSIHTALSWGNSRAKIKSIDKSFRPYTAFAAPHTRRATTLITPSVEEFNYTTLSIVEMTTSSGRGHAYWIFLLWTGKFEFRLISNFSAADEATSTKLCAVEEDHFLHGLLKSSSARVCRSAARGPKRKIFTPNFSKTRRPIAAIFVPLDSAHKSDQATEILVSQLFSKWGRGTPKFD